MSMTDSRGFTFVITSQFPDFKQTALQELGITYSDFLDLQSSGLLTPAFTSQLDLNSYVNTLGADYVGQSFFLQLSDPSKKIPGAQITAFSSVGHELRSVIPLQKDSGYDAKLQTWLASQSCAIQSVQK
jgi:hypothetical protein